MNQTPSACADERVLWMEERRSECVHSHALCTAILLHTPLPLDGGLVCLGFLFFIFYFITILVFLFFIFIFIYYLYSFRPHSPKSTSANPQDTAEKPSHPILLCASFSFFYPPLSAHYISAK